MQQKHTLHRHPWCSHVPYTFNILYITLVQSSAAYSLMMDQSGVAVHTIIDDTDSVKAVRE